MWLLTIPAGAGLFGMSFSRLWLFRDDYSFAARVALDAIGLIGHPSVVVLAMLIAPFVWANSIGDCYRLSGPRALALTAALVLTWAPLLVILLALWGLGNMGS